MFQKFRELKDAPKATRERYAFLTAAAITLVITGIWMVSLPSQFADMTVNDDSKMTTDEAGNIARVYEDFKAQFASVFSSMRTDVSEVENLVETATTDSESGPAQTEPAQAIDISGMFTTSTTPTASGTRMATPRTVLIATTSATTTARQTD